MSTTEPELATITSAATTDLGVVADLAHEAAAREPHLITAGPNDLTAFVLTDEDGGQRVEIVDVEKYLGYPTRKTGSVSITDHAGLIEHTNRHKTLATTLWGDYRSGRIVAVFDDHQASVNDDGETDGGLAGWGEHRATFTAQQSEDWKHWTSKDGRMMNQTDFAEHLEDGVDAIRTPSAADMLELAQFFQANNKLAYRSARRLDSGETQLVYEETVTAKAGQKGDTAIPSIITLGLPPFDRTDPYRVDARFRYRINDGQLFLGYKLIRPDKVLQAAFDDITTEVQDQTGLPIIAGTPRSAA